MTQRRRLTSVLQLSVCLLILKVTGSVVLGYTRYFPPDFSADFLLGRESYFFDGYHWAFYWHIATSPLTLVFGMVLLSDRFRMRFPKWHAWLGKVQVALILLGVFPSGLGMAFYAGSGWTTNLAFVLLAVSTAACALIGWRTAVQKQFAIHRIWMQRCFVLLCSAVVIRVMGGAFFVANLQDGWTYALSAWVCWVVPLIAIECFHIRTTKRSKVARHQS